MRCQMAAYETSLAGFTTFIRNLQQLDRVRVQYILV